MLTQTMPAVTRALFSAMPPGAIAQLSQALGNCNQPLTHRGSVNIQPSEYLYDNAKKPTGQWNPANYRDILPVAGQPYLAGGSGGPGTGGYWDVPGWGRPGGWNSYNYGGDSFYFPTNQEFQTNNYYGGPTTNIGGNTTFENAFTENLSVTNLEVRNISTQTTNNNRTFNTFGDQITNRNFNNRNVFNVDARQTVNIFNQPSGGGGDPENPALQSRVLRYLSGANPRVDETLVDIEYPTNAIKHVTVAGGEISYTTDSVGIPTTFTINDDCSITAGGVIDITFVTGVTISPITVTVEPADTKSQPVVTRVRLEGVIPLEARVAVP